MSRKQPPDAIPGRRIEDPKEAYSTEQLAEVGAIILIWNQIETLVDWLVHVSLRLPIMVFWDVVRRISGVRAKVDLLRLSAERSNILNDDAPKCMKITLDGVLEYKGYRDNIAHSVPYDIDKGIVHTFKYGTQMTQTLVTMDALNGLYLRFKLLLDE